MAYPTVDGPYGLRSINMVGGQSMTGSVRHIPIASGYATNICFGDVVIYASDGTLEIATTGDEPVGVFMGCAYTDSTQGFLNRQYWPASQVASDAVGYVLDDPDALYKVVVCATGTTTPATLARSACINYNYNLEFNAGSTTTGNSKMGIDDGTGATTATLPLRVIDVVEETKNVSTGEYYEVIVKLNNHRYYDTTGVA